MLRERLRSARLTSLTALPVDPWRSSILLVAGDKTGQWNAWYQLAEQRYELYVKERQAEEGGS
ncbi:hypothetical protein [Nonomuraea insulae]|uniref:Uncharacterized protein n=1 Tax=Nonomuraea insulae TaxID=1616787 RepID=A0ABW1CEI7_9ACTN